MYKKNPQKKVDTGESAWSPASRWLQRQHGLEWSGGAPTSGTDGKVFDPFMRHHLKESPSIFLSLFYASLFIRNGSPVDDMPVRYTFSPQQLIINPFMFGLECCVQSPWTESTHVCSKGPGKQSWCPFTCFPHLCRVHRPPTFWLLLQPATSVML